MTQSDTKLMAASLQTAGRILPDASYLETSQDAPWILRVRFDDFNEAAGKLSAYTREEGLVFAGNMADYSAAIPCFTERSAIATRTGQKLVSELAAGDEVLTRDNGLQKVRWVGRRRFGWRALGLNPMLRPICIAAGAIGASNTPDRDLIVSPNHKLLIATNGDERLIAASSLLGNAGVTRLARPEVCYYQVMCEAHELLLVDNCWSESYRPCLSGLSALDEIARSELKELLPSLLADRDSYTPVRLDLALV
jgi:hypothetical protein